MGQGGQEGLYAATGVPDDDLRPLQGIDAPIIGFPQLLTQFFLGIVPFIEILETNPGGAVCGGFPLFTNLRVPSLVMMPHFARKCSDISRLRHRDTLPHHHSERT